MHIVELHDEAEAKARKRLTEHYAPICGDVNSYVDLLLSCRDAEERFNYLTTVLGPLDKLREPTVLVSGFSAGSEMIVARRFGLQEVCGVEIDSFLLSVCQERLGHIPSIRPASYDGEHLPFADESFSLVISAHIIEHVSDPASYLLECLRVIKTEGYLFLEFPTRYHWKELHTNLPSVEWLPRSIRNSCLWLLSHRLSPLNENAKRGYETVLNTKLKQVSFSWVRRQLRCARFQCKIVHWGHVMPGVVRCVIKKATATARL